MNRLFRDLAIVLGALLVLCAFVMYADAAETQTSPDIVATATIQGVPRYCPPPADRSQTIPSDNGFWVFCPSPKQPPAPPAEPPKFEFPDDPPADVPVVPATDTQSLSLITVLAALAGGASAYFASKADPKNDEPEAPAPAKKE